MKLSFRFFSDTNQSNFESYLDGVGRTFTVERYVITITDPTETDTEMAKDNGGLEAD